MSQYPEARFLKSADAEKQFVPDTGREVAVAGRSNAGKSSAINVIVNRRQFARTSKTPGRTQLVNFFALGAERRGRASVGNQGERHLTRARIFDRYSTVVGACVQVVPHFG